jgi:probable O-glycosylation ligase (exosortase A-associated)
MMWITVTTIFALNPENAVPMWIRVIKIFVMTFVLMLLLNTKRHVDLLVGIIVGSIAFYGIKGGIFTILTGGGSMVYGPEDSVMAGNNSLGVANVMIIPLLAHFYQQSRTRWVRWGLLGAILLCTTATLGSYSRGAILALGAMGTVLWLRSSHKVVTLVLALATVVILVPLMPERWDQRMRTIEAYEQDGSAMGRINAWQTSWNLARDRFMAGGFEYPTADVVAKYSPVPVKTAPRAAGGVVEGPVAHSIYFQVLGEHGFLGLALFLAFWILVWRDCAWTRTQARDLPELRWAYSLMSMVQASLIGYAVGGAFLNLAFWDMPYYIYAVVIVTRYVVRTRIASEATVKASASVSPFSPATREWIPG